jgi:hypothetical protein
MDMTNILLFSFCNKTLQNESCFYKILVKKAAKVSLSMDISHLEEPEWANKSDAIAICP